MTDLPPLAVVLMRQAGPAAVIAAVLAAAFGGWVRRRLGTGAAGNGDPLRPWPARAWGAAAAAVAWPLLFAALLSDWKIGDGGFGP